VGATGFAASFDARIGGNVASENLTGTPALA
jgi:hypothetical protein